MCFCNFYSRIVFEAHISLSVTSLEFGGFWWSGFSYRDCWSPISLSPPRPPSRSGGFCHFLYPGCSLTTCAGIRERVASEVSLPYHSYALPHLRLSLSGSTLLRTALSTKIAAITGRSDEIPKYRLVCASTFATFRVVSLNSTMVLLFHSVLSGIFMTQRNSKNRSSCSISHETQPFPVRICSPYLASFRVCVNSLPWVFFSTCFPHLPQMCHGG